MPSAISGARSNEKAGDQYALIADLNLNNLEFLFFATFRRGSKVSFSDVMQTELYGIVFDKEYAISSFVVPISSKWSGLTFVKTPIVDLTIFCSDIH